jgi:cytochrome c oxidase assembly factor CtaG
VDLKLTGHPVVVPRRARSRRWLAAAGAGLVVICLVPPLSVLGRRYLFVESIQFCVFALAAPALVVLGAPWRLVRWPSGADRLAHRLAQARRRRASFIPALGYLVAWVAACLCWRLPPVLDALARYPVLIVAEAVTLCAAGTGLWLELVPSPPLAPRLARPQRAFLAALAMWSIWAIAYVLGFARDSVVHAYDGAGSHLATVTDQQVTAFLLWAAAGAAFVPVIFVAALSWLKDSGDPGGDAEAAGEPAGDTVRAGVRGWGWPVGGRSSAGRSSAGQGRRRHVGGQ